MPLQIPPAAVSRIKIAVPIVADMCNKRYRRRQFDSADSEFVDLEKTEYKGNPLLSGGGFFALYLLLGMIDPENCNLGN